MKEESSSEKEALALLSQLESVLESDLLIDEVGYIHPSQFSSLNEETDGSLPSSENDMQQISDKGTLEYDTTKFWSRGHKLGISTQILLPLCKAAKQVFTEANRQYGMLSNLFDKSGNDFTRRYNALESEVMRHSRALLLLSSDFGTAWNSRKLVVSKKQEISIFTDELLLSSLVLSNSPKSEHAWSHRRWVIKIIARKCLTLREILGKESELVERLSERSKMNYRAWNHRHWLVSYMTKEQVVHELKESRKWAGLHAADNSCFHYRRCLMIKNLEYSCHKQEAGYSGYDLEIYSLWKEELDWNEMLIKRYVGREALWLHRRFLSVCWIKNFALNNLGASYYPEDKDGTNQNIGTFMDHELQLFFSCTTIPDDKFEDFQSQAVHSATYILWLIKQIPDSLATKLQEKLRGRELKPLLNKLCPERSVLWNSLLV